MVVSLVGLMAAALVYEKAAQWVSAGVASRAESWVLTTAGKKAEKLGGPLAGWLVCQTAALMVGLLVAFVAAETGETMVGY